MLLKYKLWCTYVSRKCLVVNLRFLLYPLLHFLHCNRQQQHLFITCKITENLWKFLTTFFIVITSTFLASAFIKIILNNHLYVVTVGTWERNPIFTQAVKSTSNTTSCCGCHWSYQPPRYPAQRTNRLICIHSIYVLWEEWQGGRKQIISTCRSITVPSYFTHVKVNNVSVCMCNITQKSKNLIIL